MEKFCSHGSSLWLQVVRAVVISNTEKENISIDPGIYKEQIKQLGTFVAV